MKKEFSPPPFETNTDALVSKLPASEQINNALSIIFEIDWPNDYGDEPYQNHLLRTAIKVYQAGHSESLVIAALLHDIVEDTEVTTQEVRENFGEYIAEVVEAVTYNELDGAAGIDKLAKARRLLGSQAVKLADAQTNLNKATHEYESGIIDFITFRRRWLRYTHLVEVLSHSQPTPQDTAEEEHDYTAAS